MNPAKPGVDKWMLSTITKAPTQCDPERGVITSSIITTDKTDYWNVKGL